MSKVATQTTTEAAPRASQGPEDDHAPAWPDLGRIMSALPDELAEVVGVGVGGLTIQASPFGARFRVAGGDAAELQPHHVAALHAILGDMLVAWQEAA